MARSRKQNDRDHAALAAGTSTANDHLPRFFGKHGHADANPKKAKKDGAGKGGWGVEGEEYEDTGYNLANARRRSNSSSYTTGLKAFKTKFETVEDEPVFEESLHGAISGTETPNSSSDAQSTHSIEKVNTISSEDSVDEEEKPSSKTA
jgi:hypothetical protein